MKSLIITLKTPPQTILEAISKWREQKGKEKESLALINQALKVGNDWVINLFWEEALTWQHLIMNENTKLTGADKIKKSAALLQMQKAILKAKFYVEKYELRHWKSRVHRFMGRLYDYQGNYKKAATEYKQGLSLVKLDPDFVEKGYPRWLELDAFRSFSLIMGGSIEDGVRLAKSVYKKFDSKEIQSFKNKDYSAWAIWKTGIPIRTVNALLDKNLSFNKKETVNWINEAEEVLDVVKKSDLWADFSYRKAEFGALRKRLQTN